MAMDLGRLNAAQRAAATHGAGPLLIVAGAGTGKTLTLAARVAHLLRQGAAPERLLLLTFSRRAAREMLDRASAVVSRQAVAGVWGGTFHAVAHRLLRHLGGPAGLPPDFTVLDQADADEDELMALLERAHETSEVRSALALGIDVELADIEGICLEVETTG